MSYRPGRGRAGVLGIAVGLSLLAATALSGCSGNSTGSPSSSATASAASSSAASSASTPASSAPAPAPASSGAAGNDAPNGVADRTTAEIITLMKAAGINATSVHVQGEVTQGSSSSGIDMRLGKDGGAGTITESGATVQLVVTPKTVYVKAPADFLKQQYGDKAATLPEGKWLAIDAASQEGQQFASFGSANAFLDSFLASVPNNLVKAPTEDVNGRPAIALTSPSQTPSASASSSVAAAAGATIWVATTGEPYLLRIAPKAGSGGIDFVDWDAPVTVTPPAETDVVPLSSLK